MKDLRAWIGKSGLVSVMLLTVLLVVVFPLTLDIFRLNLIGKYLCYAFVAVGLVMLWGWGGVLSLGQGVFFGLGGYAIAMHLKLADLGATELPDFMVWSGVTALPWWWAIFRSPLVAVLAILLVAPAIAALFAWLIFRRRIGGAAVTITTGRSMSGKFCTFICLKENSPASVSSTKIMAAGIGLRIDQEETFMGGALSMR